jgi:hypothetical protein
MKINKETINIDLTLPLIGCECGQTYFVIHITRNEDNEVVWMDQYRADFCPYCGAENPTSEIKE